MGLFHMLDDGWGSSKPEPRRHPVPEEQSSYLHHLHSRNRTSMDHGIGSHEGNIHLNLSS